MLVIERLVAAVAVFVAAHFAMGFITRARVEQAATSCSHTPTMRPRDGSSAAWTECSGCSCPR